jgi:hypothetical protein
MNLARKALSMLLLLPLVSVPTLADFKYTDTSQITGGALMGMANFAAKFSKDSRAAMQPITTTHYVKGNRLRTDGSDGSIQIIDLDGRRIISIDNQKKTYSVATFEEIKAAMEKARRDAEAKMQQENTGKPAAQAQDAQLQVTPKITVLPGSDTRVILGQPTNETKVKMDMEMQAQNNGQTPPPSTPGQPNSVTFTMTMDTYVAPNVAGYQEIGEFYKKMAKEVNWVPPSNIHVDPRMTHGMSELQSRRSPAPIRTRRRLLRTHRQTTVPSRPIPAIPSQPVAPMRLSKALARSLATKRRSNNKTTTRKQALPPRRLTQIPIPMP